MCCHGYVSLKFLVFGSLAAVGSAVEKFCTRALRTRRTNYHPCSFVNRPCYEFASSSFGRDGRTHGMKVCGIFSWEGSCRSSEYCWNSTGSPSANATLCLNWILDLWWHQYSSEHCLQPNLNSHVGEYHLHFAKQDYCSTTLSVASLETYRQ